MIDEIKSWLAGGERPAGGPEEVQIAVAALLVEAAHIDDSFDAAERATIARLLERRFGIAAPAAQELLGAAERAADRASQLFGFTRVINDRMSPAQRIELIEMLWEVAFADGKLDPLEDTLLRRVGGLIYVPDRERGAARKRVLRRLKQRADRRKPPAEAG